MSRALLTMCRGLSIIALDGNDVIIGPATVPGEPGARAFVEALGDGGVTLRFPNPDDAEFVYGALLYAARKAAGEPTDPATIAVPK